MTAMLGFGIGGFTGDARALDSFLGGNRSGLPAPLKTETVGPKPNEDASSFRRMMYVPHFQLHELTVKVVGDQVVVHGKHKERGDEHGLISREFTRKFKLPGDVNPDDLTHHRMFPNILTLEVPRRKTKGERVVPQVKRVVKQSQPWRQRYRILCFTSRN